MNNALRQSISAIFSGEVRGIICKGISVNPRITIFVEKCHVNRPFVRGFNSNQQKLSCSSDEDDKFNELGPTRDDYTKLGSSEVESAAALSKLMTEKPENLMGQSTAATLKLMTEKPEITTRNGIFKNILSDLSKVKLHPTISPKADNNKHKKASATTVDNNKHKKVSATIADNDEHKKASVAIANNKTDSDSKIPIYVRIENVPSTISLSQLMNAISKYGNTSSASMKTLPNGVMCCYVKFENKESWRNLISEGSIAIAKNKLSVSALCEKNLVMFKIKSIRKDTETNEIQSICNSFGKLEYLDRVNKNVAYAIFTSMNESETQSLLAKLNNVTFESCMWIAEVQLAEYSKDDDVHAYNKLKSKISSTLHEVRNDALLNVIDAEDLVNLHCSIMAVEGQVQTTCS